MVSKQGGAARPEHVYVRLRRRAAYGPAGYHHAGLRKFFVRARVYRLPRDQADIVMATGYFEQLPDDPESLRALVAETAQPRGRELARAKRRRRPDYPDIGTSRRVRAKLDGAQDALPVPAPIASDPGEDRVSV